MGVASDASGYDGGSSVEENARELLDPVSLHSFHVSEDAREHCKCP